VPADIALLLPPPPAPDLNPVENVRQFLPDNWLSNRVFADDDIFARCCEAWNQLIDQPSGGTCHRTVDEHDARSHYGPRINEVSKLRLARSVVSAVDGVV
jgi:hypothetical protein